VVTHPPGAVCRVNDPARWLCMRIVVDDVNTKITPLTHHCRSAIRLRMKEPEEKDLPVRKSVTMPQSMWRDIAQFQADERITTEAEALRRVVMAGLRATKAGI
jgi:hypothetical protein